MPWPPDIAEQLPAPRDDEPESLRRDIADELADHLHSAFIRELHATRNEETAKENVLDRFGNPATIATKLWFDAMWEKIMSQRITIAALVVVVLASLGSTGLTWFLVDQARQANQVMLEQGRAANAALVEQSRAVNEALLKKLGEFAVAPRSVSTAEPSLEWNQVNVRLYSGDKPGKPAEGFTVKLTGYVLDTAKEVSVTRTSDARGVAEMGLIRPGQHKVTVKAPWGETRKETRLTVLPGQALTEEIACPNAAPDKTQIEVAVDWPEDLKAKGCWAVCHFAGEPRIVEGETWTMPGRENEMVLIVDSNDEIHPIPLEWQPDYTLRVPGEMSRPDWPFGLQRIDETLRETGELPIGLVTLGARPHVVRIEGRESNAVQDQGSRISRYVSSYGFLVPSRDADRNVRCLAGGYRLDTILVTGSREKIVQADLADPRRNMFPGLSGSAAFRPGRPDSRGAIDQRRDMPTGATELIREDDERMSNVRKLAVLAGFVERWPYSRFLQQQQHPSLGYYYPLRDWVTSESSESGISASQRNKQRLKEQPTFIAQPGTLNHWQIELPARLLELVRENPLFAEDAGAAVPAEEATRPAEPIKKAE